MDMLNDLRPLVAEYGPVFSLRLGGYTIVVLASAEAIHEVCVTKAASCAGRPHFLNMDAISGGGQSTLLGSGEAWITRRRLLLRAFLQPDHLPELADLVNDEISTALKRIDPIDQSVIEMRMFADLFHEARFDVMARMLTASPLAHDQGVFGRVRAAIEAESRHFGLLLADFIPLLRPLTRLIRLRPLIAGIRHFRNFFGSMIRKREVALRQGASRRGILDALLIERENMRAAGSHVDAVDRYCGAEALPYMIYNLFGTMNPTHITVMWALWLVLHSPDVLARILDEIDRVRKVDGAQTDAPPTLQQLSELTYLEAVIQETMRFQPPTPSLVPRLVTEDIVTSQGYLIPRGAIVMANIASLEHEKAVWGDPEVFRPERFLQDSDGRLSRDELASYHVPFGVGPRACPAKNLGTTIIKLWLLRLLERFDLSLVEKHGSVDAGSIKNQHWKSGADGAYIFNAMPKDFRVRIAQRRRPGSRVASTRYTELRGST